MGMFDTLVMTCPHCKETTTEQSKSGPCSLSNYCPEDAPASILEDLSESTLFCEKCSEPFHLKVQIIKTVRAVAGRIDDDDDEEY